MVYLLERLKNIHICNFVPAFLRLKTEALEE